MRSKARPEGWFKPAHLKMALTFECLTEPHYAARGIRGHFEQSGRVSGIIELGEERWEVNGYGVRDKSWGPRDWGAQDRETGQSSPPIEAGPKPFVNWFSMNFGDYAALGGSCFRHKDGVVRGEGWLQRDGKSVALKNLVIATTYQPESIIHETVHLTGETEEGEALDIEGTVDIGVPDQDSHARRCNVCKRGVWQNLSGVTARAMALRNTGTRCRCN